MLTDYRILEQRLSRNLDLKQRPVAVAFRDSPPEGVEKFSGTEPAGCSFWRIAAKGRTFYTLPNHHYNCAIGSYTHNIPLPDERAQELAQALAFMTSIGYVSMDEVPGIPRLSQTPGVVIYAPLGDTPVDPDVVIFTDRPGRLMLLEEAAIRAGVSSRVPALARPTCVALPAAISQGFVASTGCIGNRVYTDLGEDDLYVVVAGNALAKIAGEIETVSVANAKLADYHRERKQLLMTP
jgi:uncharacterized protein (DUF169 family)